MSSAAVVNRDFVELVASEMACCVGHAVERWITEFESVLNDPRLTTLGRLQGVRDIVGRYRVLNATTNQVGTAAPGRPAERSSATVRP